MQKLNTNTNLVVFGEKAILSNKLSMFILMLFLSFSVSAQTTLEGGDIAILGVNANNNICSGSSGAGEDVITFVAFQDITNGTEIDLTDNGWERVNAGLWGDSEGTLRFTYSGGTITAGTSFEIIFGNDLPTTQSENPNWTITDLNNAPVGTLNMNSGGDQIYIMQNGAWDNMGATGDHNATYDGNILYGFNTRSFWAADGTSQQSNLHPDVDPCYFMNPTGGTTNYTNYTGPTSPTTQLEWINRIKDPNNWSTYATCLDYNLNPPPSVITINSSGISVACSVCSGCSPVNDDLIFDLPNSGGPFNVVYTDGSTDYTLNGINDQHTENVTVTTTTTFDIVSVTDVNGCPVFSNFEGSATINVDGNGGNAVLSGGGVLCVGQCTEVTFTVTGGQAPYEITFNVSLGPFNVDFTIPVPDTDFSINVCSDDVILPEWDPGTNTITLPDFVVTNVVITLISLTDDSGCAGTVDPTPLDIDIENTPDANNAGPLEACDEGGNQATFDLTSLDNTVNGGNGNTVTWYEDVDLNTQIGNTGSYTSSTTTVYATVTQGNCESEPVAVDLIVNSIPMANPASAEACDDNGSGFAVFDLTLLDNTVNGGNGDPVSWYFDAGGNSDIADPTNFNTNSTTVYATVSNGVCESATVSVTLTVNTSPSANPTSDEACDEGGGVATFDLTTLDIIVNNGSGDPVIWYSDPGGNSQIPDPSQHVTVSGSVFAEVSNGVCTSAIVEIILTVNPTPTANTTSATECDQGGGSAIFDLTELNFIVNGGTGDQVSWFFDENTTILIPDPTNFVSTTGSVWAIVDNGTCQSDPVEVFLIVSPAPTANPTNDQECDDGNGSATFNLTDLDNAVNGGTGQTVIWYFDPGGTSEIPDPTNYTTNGGSVYAAVSNGACTSSIVQITLTIEPIPTANSTSDQACDDGSNNATFDLTLLNNDVNGNSGMIVNWYFDINGTSSIPDPTNLTINGSLTVYATVFNGSCESTTVPVNLIIVPQPEANTASDQACDDGSGSHIFNLTDLDDTVNGGNGNTVTWYTDANGNDIIADPANFDSGSASVFASVSNGTCISEIVEIILTLDPQPEGNTASDQACDDGSGSYTFNLSDLDDTVNGGNGNTVTWYTDANGNDIIADPANFDSGPTSVYAIVSNGICVSEIVEIILTLDEQPEANTASDQACDDGSGTYSFNLTDLNATVDGGNGNTVTWYTDANGNDIIADPANFDSGSASVFASVSNGICVSEIVEIILTLDPQPEANTASDQACDDGSGTYSFNLTDLNATVDGGNGNTVTWYTDANGNDIIADPANFDSGSTSVFASVSNGTCVSEIVEIILTLDLQPEVNSASDQACDDGSGTYSFNLTDLNATVNGGNGNTVTWYTDANGNDIIADPANFDSGSTSVFASVSNGDCISEIVEIILTLDPQPEANTADSESCDEGNGEASFNLDALENTVNGGNANNVTWYEDINATIEITSPYSSPSTVIYAVVDNGNCFSEIVEITLTVSNEVEANPANLEVCDEGNGEATFDLTTVESIVNGGTADPVNWYEDSNATISIPDTYPSGTTTVYAVVGNGNCISEPVAVELIVNDIPDASPASDELCDEGTGEATFELTNLENTVNVNTSNTVSWFEDINATIPITPPFSTSSTVVYAIVDNGNCSSAVVAVSLNVAETPEANSTSADECDSGDGTATFILDDLNSTINNGTANAVTFYSDSNATTEVISPFNTNTTTIYAVVDNGDCLSEIVEINLNVTDAPIANPTSADECDLGDGTATFILDDLASTINNGTANPVSFYFDINLTIEIPSPYNTISNIIYAVVGSGDCLSEPVQIILNVTDAPAASPTSADECDLGDGTATFELDDLTSIVNNGTANAVTYYSDINATTEITSPFNSSTTTIYAVVGSGNCVSEVVEINLNVTDAPAASPAAADECDEGNGTASFELEDLVTTINNGTANAVTFYSDSNATTEISSPFNSSSAIVYAVVGSGNCISEIVEINLNVSDMPVANLASADECDLGDGTATFELGDLTTIINNGTANTVTFYSDINTTTEITSPYNTNSAIVYAIVGSGDCVSEVVEINLNVNDAPDAISTSADECDLGDGTATFELSDLTTIINNGTANTVTFYSDINATTEINSPFNTNPATIYAIVDNGNCVSEVVEINLNVTDAPIANPAATDECDLGDGTATFELDDLISTINNGTANAVTFYSDVNATIEVTAPFNTSSTIIYAIVGSGDCISEVVEINLNVNDLPIANPAATDECDLGDGTAAFELDDLISTINNGTANPVIFYSDINATTEISSPFNTNAASVFAIVGNGNCESEVVEIILNVNDLPEAIPTADDECDLGDGTATFELNDLISTINNGTANAVTFYSDINASIEITSPFNTNSTSIYAIVDNGNCVSEVVEVSLIVNDLSDAISTSSDECDLGDGTADFDLADLAPTINNGTANTVIFYSDINTTTEISSPFNTNTTIIYAVVDNGECLSEVVEINLNVNNQPEAIPTTANECDLGDGTANFELNDLASIINNGTANTVTFYSDINTTTEISSPFNTDNAIVYAVVSSPAGCISQPVPVDLTILEATSIDYIDTLCEDESVDINGTIYDLNSPTGTEILIGAAMNGCDSIIEVDLNFYDPVIGSIVGATSICNGQSSTITFNLSGASSYDITYSDGINPPVTLNNISDGHIITVNPTATTTYTLLDVIGINIPCNSTIPSNSVTITVTENTSFIDILSDYQGFGVSCNGENDGSIEAIPLTGTAPFTYQWSNSNSSAVLNNISAGNYSVTITDALGCTSENNVSLSEPPTILTDVETITPDCFGDLDGSIIIQSIDGINSPFEYSLDGEFFNTVPDLPFTIVSPPGIYELTIQDVNDCAVIENILVETPVETVVDLGDDITITLGDSVQLEAFVNFDVSQIIWNRQDISCVDCLDPVAFPFETTTYSLTAFDSLGCSGTDEIMVFVEKDRNVFIPTAFSPDGDGFNDIFFINANQTVTNVSKFRIFNRWGETIYAIDDISPNDNSVGWDGSFKGEYMNPGVFVYLFEVEFIDGQVRLYKGSITLLH